MIDQMGYRTAVWCNIDLHNFTSWADLQTFAPYPVKTSNCACKDHRDKIKVLDPEVKDLISNKL